MSYKIGFIAALCAFACIAGSAHAETPADSLKSATATLAGKFGAMEDYNAPPADSDPTVAKSLSDIRSAMDLFGTDAFPVDGFNTFYAVCGPLNTVMVRYVMAGANDIPGFKQNTPAAQSGLIDLANRNSVKYQDDLVPLMANAAKCAALHLPSFAHFWDGLAPADRTQARIDGLRHIKHGAGEMLAGLASTATETAYSQKNRDLAIDTAAAYADAMAQTLSLKERAALLAEIADEAPGLAAAYPGQFATIKQALTQTVCTGLCAAL